MTAFVWAGAAESVLTSIVPPVLVIVLADPSGDTSSTAASRSPPPTVPLGPCTHVSTMAAWPIVSGDASAGVENRGGVNGTSVVNSLNAPTRLRAGLRLARLPLSSGPTYV